MKSPFLCKFGNWGWRIGESGSIEKLGKEAERLRQLLGRYDRLSKSSPPKQKVETDSADTAEQAAAKEKKEANVID
jgi:N-acetylglucosamine kinase-like BadF-type ATPase